MTYHCDVCKKYYKTYNSLWTHNKKFHNNPETVNKSIIKEKKEIKCNICNKNYANYSNLRRHKETCKNKPIEINNQQNIMDLIKTLLPHIANNQSFQSGNNNNNGDNNNANSNNTTNNITISFGNENVSDVLTNQEQIKILKQKQNALESIIKMVHFNKKYPQFHNIAIDNDMGYSYNDSLSKFEEVEKEKLLYTLIENRINDIDDINQENKIKIPKTIYKYINNYIESFDNSNVEKKNVEEMELIVSDETQTLLDNNAIKLTD